jgi:hypothetical protein
MREEDTLDNTKVDILRTNNHFFELISLLIMMVITFYDIHTI